MAGEVFIFGAGGNGGGGLNFQVVGNPQPSNPKENTIWVDTNTNIPGWEISTVSDPSWAMQEGFVYFTSEVSTWDDSTAIDVLKKNDAYIKIIKAKQYVSGEWVGKSVKVFKNGAWTSLITYLFDKGNQNIELTGGWSKDICSIYPYHGNGGSTSIGNTLKMDVRMIPNTGYLGASIVCTKNKIDLTNVDTITVKASVSKTYYYHCVGVSTLLDAWDDGGYWNAPAWKQLANGTTVLDVSKLTGPYYVMIGSHTPDDESAVTVEVSEVYME